MDQKETNKGLNVSDLLLYNDEYFQYVYKKTEKIVTAVFFTTRTLRDVSAQDDLVTFIEDKARTLLVVAEKTLRTTESARRLRLEELHIALIGMESALSVGVGAHLISQHAFEVFRHELTSVHKTLRDFNKSESAPVLTLTPSTHEGERQRRRVTPQRSAGEGPGEKETGVGSPNRRDRILSIIRDKGHASIKDVSSVISDCSEKTIQRELMSLISEGQIIKEGERRWSRYSLAQ